MCYATIVLCLYLECILDLLTVAAVSSFDQGNPLFVLWDVALVKGPQAPRQVFAAAVGWRLERVAGFHFHQDPSHLFGAPGKWQGCAVSVQKQKKLASWIDFTILVTVRIWTIGHVGRLFPSLHFIASSAKTLMIDKSCTVVTHRLGRCFADTHFSHWLAIQSIQKIWALLLFELLILA